METLLTADRWETNVLNIANVYMLAIVPGAMERTLVVAGIPRERVHVCSFVLGAVEQTLALPVVMFMMEKPMTAKMKLLKAAFMIVLPKRVIHTKDVHIYTRMIKQIVRAPVTWQVDASGLMILGASLAAHTLILLIIDIIVNMGETVGTTVLELLRLQGRIQGAKSSRKQHALEFL